MFNSIKTRLKGLKKQGKYGAGYVDTVVKVITCVVVGALLLTGIYAIANTGMTTASNKTDSLFSYEAELPGGPGGAGGGGALPDGEDSGPIEMLDKTDNYEKAHAASQSLTFRSSAPIDTFDSVEVNGVTVDPSHYTLTEGSTIVTFDKEYAYSLPIGTHEVDIVSEKGTANAEFTVSYTPGLYDESGSLIMTWDEIKAAYPNAIKNGKILDNDMATYFHSLPSGKLVISDEITEVCGWAFCDCEQLTDVVIPNSVKTIGWAAFANVGAKSFIIPDSVESVDVSSFSSPYNKEFIVDVNNPNYCSVDGAVFTKDMKTLVGFPANTTIENYEVPNGVERILATAMTGNTSIKSITLSDTVKIVETLSLSIGEQLEKIYIPTSVKVVCRGFLNEYDDSLEIYYEGSKDDWNNILEFQMRGDETGGPFNPDDPSYTLEDVMVERYPNVTVHYNSEF